MNTGLLVRDFYKTERELRYSNSGSIGFTEIEKNAYRLSLTLEITNLDGPRYGSKKTLPDNSHYGYCTLFRGSTVTETLPVKYPKIRIFDIINQGIWNYHQATESLQLLSAVTVESGKEVATNLVQRLGNNASEIICFLIELNEGLEGSETAPWILELLGCDDSGVNVEKRIDRRYRGFPIASPFPDIAKFKGDVPLSYLWRLEAWYLVNPAVYVVDNPTDTGDQTDGEDEAPVPDSGDGDGDGSEFPAPSPPGPGRDPRDFGGPGAIEPPPTTVYSWFGTGDATILGGSGFQETAPVQVTFTYELNGAPFTAENGPNFLVNASGGAYYNGIVIKDRFGQLVISEYAGVGFSIQTIPMTFVPSEIPPT